MLPDPDAPPAAIGAREIVVALCRHWWLVAACTVIGGVVVAGLSILLQPEAYRSTAVLLVNQEGPADLIIQRTEGDPIPEREVQNEATFAESASVQQRAEETLGFEADIAAEGSALADVLELTATEETAALAQEVAAAYADAFISLRIEADQTRFEAATTALETQIDALRLQVADTTNAAERDRLLSRIEDYERSVNDLGVSVDAANGGVVVLAEPELPDEPVSPKPVRNGLAGALLGLAIGVALAIVRHTTDDRLRSAAELESDMPEVRVLGEVPGVPRAGSRRDAAPYRILATTIHTRIERRGIRSILVTGFASGFTTGSIVAHLAAASAQAGHRTIAVDADITHPTFHRAFGLDPSPGIVDVLAGGSNPWDACRPIGIDSGLQVLTAGEAESADTDLLFGSEARGLVRTLESLESETTTLIVAPDFDDGGLEMAAVVNAVILIAPEGFHKSLLREAIRRLDRSDAEVVGVIFARVGAPNGSS